MLLLFAILAISSCMVFFTLTTFFDYRSQFADLTHFLAMVSGGVCLGSEFAILVIICVQAVNGSG